MAIEGGARGRQTTLGAAISLLRTNRDFAKLYSAQLISFAGDWFLTVALLGLVLEVTGSPAMASLVLVAQLLPFFLFSPVAGVLADRLDRRRLMVGADVARALICLGFLGVNDAGDVWLALVLQGALSALGAVFEPASAAAVPNVVERKDLATANVLVGSAWGTMLAVGAALGGLVSAAFGRDVAFLGDAASFAVSAAIVLTVRRRLSEAREGPHVRMREAVVETARYARRDRRVLALLAVKGGFGLAGGVILLLPVFATEVYDAGDVGIGVLMAARGLGAVIGPFIGRAFIRDDDRDLFTVIGVALVSYALFYAAFPFVSDLWVAFPLVVLAHLGGGAQWTLSTYGLQRIVPDRIRGRVFAFDYMLVTLSITISNLATGAAADRVDPRLVMGGLAVVAFAYAVAWRRLAAGAVAPRAETAGPTPGAAAAMEASPARTLPAAEGPREERRAP